MKTIFKISITAGINALDAKTFSKFIEVDFPLSNLATYELAQAVNPAQNKRGEKKFSDKPHPICTTIARIDVNLSTDEHKTVVTLAEIHLQPDEWEKFGENIAQALIRKGWERLS